MNYQIIEASEKFLTFKGDDQSALYLVNSIQENYQGDMPKMLNDFVFNIEVALQNAGILNNDFELIEEK
jgi:hypothetical protein